ncbi:MAG: LacI family DNA-binding transcriptional regulator [Stenotrophomonas sp.]|nr:LacI family DNA-binding transcriptional regulator [Stenotrophomonas sp.]
MATIYDIANLAKVSPATVSRALSQPDLVSEATRRRVQAAVAKLGFVPNAAAKSLRTRRTGKLLVTVPDVSNPFFAEIVKGVEEAAQPKGYAVLLGDTQQQPEREESYAQILRRQEADGLIVLGHRLPPTARELVDELGDAAPVVNGCEFTPDLGVPSVHIDNAAAAHMAMEHLYALGHRRVGIVGGPETNPLHHQRLDGARAAAKGHRAMRSLSVERGDFSVESGYAAGRRLLALPHRPTAVFCFSDQMAMGVLAACREHGVNVPADLSVVGFDDLRTTRYLAPALTTISQPMRSIGHETVRVLLGILAGKPHPDGVELPFELIVRQSTAPPR